MSSEQYEKWRREMLEKYPPDAFDRVAEAVGRLSWFEKILYSLILWAAIFRLFGVI